MIEREWTFADVLPLPKKPQKLPVVTMIVIETFECAPCRTPRMDTS
jgi:hypothetical protein